MERRGGSVAVYGKSDFYTVDAVSAISTLKNFSEDRRQGQSGDESGKGNKGFATVLETEIGRTGEASNISVRTSGYTRMGMPAALFINMRDYTYQK
ncbi:MAG: hypothetical protein MJ130_11035 [Lachnospiraceae bacterium]|nr:hypothetical protein [Lachnospiraceae bacterium]